MSDARDLTCDATDCGDPASHQIAFALLPMGAKPLVTNVVILEFKRYVCAKHAAEGCDPKEWFKPDVRERINGHLAFENAPPLNFATARWAPLELANES